MNRIVAIVHTPPPTHGAALVGKKVINKIASNNKFNLKTIQIKASKDIQEIGSFKLGKIISSFSMLFELLRYLIFFRPQTVYFTASLNGFALLRDVVLILVIKLFHIPRICLHLHTIGVNRNLNKKGYSFLYNILFYNVEVITLSDFSKQDLCNYFDVINKIHILPNSCPQEPRVIRSACEHTQRSYNFLYISNLMDEKGYKYALELAYELQTEHGIKLNFKFAGSWGSEDDKKYFSKYISDHNMASYVEYLGMVSGESKEALLLNSDVLVFPSFYSKESFPLVLLEAMAYEMAIITTNHAAIPYVVTEDFALLCEPKMKISSLDVIRFLNDLPSKKASANSHYNKLYSDNAFENRLFRILENRVSDD